jgi:hypothetical protein
MIQTIFQSTETTEAAGFWRVAAARLYEFGRELCRFRSDKRRETAPEIQAQIAEALSVHLEGNPDLGCLLELAAAHRDDVQETILRYQTVVAGQRHELCELTIRLGYVQQWCDETHSMDLRKRRAAFSHLAAVSHYGPVRRLAGGIPATGFQNSDEHIRLEAARILLLGGEPAEVTRVFEAVFADTPAVRQSLARELGRHATQLCEAAVPQALRWQNPREVLSLLVSWERSLPLPDMRMLANHGDPGVRLEVMRLLPFLPATEENRDAVLRGLRDKEPDVCAAAAIAAGRLMIPHSNSISSDAAEHWMAA